VGGNSAIPIDSRVIAATHRDLEGEVEARRFREDLYYRLKVVPIELPPLRDRLHDLPALADRFLQQFALRLQRPKLELTPHALAKLSAYAWPGNVRELRNVIEQAAALSKGPLIGEADVQLEKRRPQFQSLAPGVTFAEAKRHAIEEFERHFLLRALAEHDHNISRAAEAIGMVRQSLQQKLKELGIRPGEKGRDE
jgi:DNA-binding NtrC family response regulator